MPINRNEIRMGGRYQRRTETNEDNTGARGTLALDTRSISLKFYKFGEVKKYYDVNILPFRVGRNNPAVVAGELREGDWDYSVDYFVHKNVGPDKGTYRMKTEATPPRACGPASVPSCVSSLSTNVDAVTMCPCCWIAPITTSPTT